MPCGSFGASVGSAGGLGAIAVGFEVIAMVGMAAIVASGVVALISMGLEMMLSQVDESSLCTSFAGSWYLRPILYLTLRNRFSVCCSTMGAGTVTAGDATAATVPSRLACRMTLTR